MNTNHRRMVTMSALLLVLFLQEQRGFSGMQTGAKDETLEANVEERLRMEGRIHWDQLKVESKEGQVTLYGIVKSNEERGFAEKAANTVRGVASVVNKLIVEPAMPESREAPKARINEETRDRVIEGPEGLKDRQILP